MLSIRGATSVVENSIDEIEKKSVELIEKIIEINKLDINNIKVMLFSCTKDITKAYPGFFVRNHFDLNNVSIMHFNEMDVENSLKLCIRVTIICEEHNKEPKFVYLHNAKNLRKDIKS